MGTIAGDDTVLLILRRGYTEQETFAALDTLADGLETPE
jgi:arginine repressor